MSSMLRNLDLADTKVAFARKSNASLFEAYLVFQILSFPWLVYLSSRFIVWALKLKLPVGFFIRHTIFRQFCGGTQIEECRPVVNRMSQYGVCSILDYSVEGSERREQLDAVAEEIICTILHAQKNPGVAMAVFKVSGIIAIKDLESFAQQSSLINSSVMNGKERIRKICAAAAQHRVPLLIDAEESWIQDPIDEIVLEMMREFNRGDRCIVYNTLQMYRHDRLDYLHKLHEIAQREGFWCGVKLVRGAYMEKERDRASKHGYPSPIHADKTATDQDFDAAVEYVVEHLDQKMALFAGTHNEPSTRLLVSLMQKKNIGQNDKRIWFSQLYGMSDHLSFNLAAAGYNVAKYLPYGPVEAVLPYLFRRAQENTSVSGHAGRELTLLRSEVYRRLSQPSLSITNPSL